MKGPGLRRKMAVQRRWKCPACGRKVITDGDVTALPCACTDPPRWMTMEDPPRNPRPVPRIPDATTLTDEDLDRLGIEALSEPSVEIAPPETQPNIELLAEDALADGDTVIEQVPTIVISEVTETVSEMKETPEPAQPPHNVEAEPPAPDDSSDDFGAGLDDPV